jgi:hypothetical protein
MPGCERLKIHDGARVVASYRHDPNEATQPPPTIA